MNREVAILGSQGKVQPPPEGDDVGEVGSYRGRDCLDRWDLIVDEDDVPE